MTNDVNNLKASKLNGAINITGNKRVGPSIVLKVMTGDTISISTWSWYTGAVQAPPTGLADIATELLPLLTGGVAARGGTHGGAIPSTTSGPLLSADLTSFLTNNRPYVNTRPKAFLNWMVIDEEFGGVSSPNHMNAVQIPVCNAGDTLKQVVGPANMVIRRNGWIYIYLSNESAQDVYFDNLVINLKHGPLVEQKDYYAFGLEIPGLSTQALKRPYDQNRYRYNGIEYDSALGLDYYEAKYRDYDAQIGRFTQIDPKVESAEGWSVYSGMLDNPVLNSDPLGDSSIFGNWLDRHGWGFREPTSEQWENHPLQSSVREFSYRLADLVGLPQAETTLRTVTDPNATTTEKVISLAAAGLAMTKGEHGLSEKVTENPVVKVENPQTNFVVSEKGTTVVIPKGASGPSAPEKGTGMVYKNGSGGHGMDKKVTGVRIMDAKGSQPSRVNYMNKEGQTVAPQTGQTISKSDKRGHVPFP